MRHRYRHGKRAQATKAIAEIVLLIINSRGCTPAAEGRRVIANIERVANVLYQMSIHFFLRLRVTWQPCLSSCLAM